MFIHSKGSGDGKGSDEDPLSSAEPSSSGGASAAAKATNMYGNTLQAVTDVHS